MACLTDQQLNQLAEQNQPPPELSEHLQQCERCRKRLAEWKENHALIEELNALVVDDVGKVEIRSDAVVSERIGSGPDRPDPGVPSDSIPGYQILREIHRGGQGVVYQAIQKTTRRKVAIKVMHEGPFASRQDRARFEREVQVLAAFKHPNIVAIHDSGTAGGSFYFVMEYVSGEPLDVYMATGQRSVRDTLVLFKKICEAIGAAHLRGVIHRDLKPGNIRIDQNGEPQILDFGLAKMAPGQIGDESAPMTMTGQFLGSAPWASPEQAEGIPGKMDIRTDVYSLGVILYQMLTGKFPYAVAGGFHEVLDRIKNAPPVRPSALRGDIDDEVQTIILKALAKERERRYQSAGELARDIGHYLADEPIDAKRDSALYVLRKHLRQYRFPVAVAAGFVLLLAMALFVSLALLRQAHKAEVIANKASQGEREQRFLAEQRERSAKESSAKAFLQEGRALHLAGRGQESCAAFVRARDQLTELGVSAFESEIGLYHSLCEFDAPIHVVTGHSGGLMAVAWLPDGIRGCSASEDGTVRLWDVRTGQLLRTFNGHKGFVMSVAVSPDGRYMLSGGGDGTVRLWEVETGTQVRSFSENKAPVRGVAFSPDGGLALFATAQPGGDVSLYDTHSGELVRSLKAPEKDPYYGVAFAPDGHFVLATSYENRIWIWDVRTGKSLPKLAGHTGYVISAAFSPDGGRVLSASYDQTLKLWDVQSGACQRTMKGHTAGVRGVAFLDHPNSALSCSMDGTLKIWNLETGEATRTFAGHTDGIPGLSVSRDGRHALSAGIDKTLEVWDLATNNEAPSVSEGGTVTSLSCSADGTTFVSGDFTGSVKLRDLATLRVLQSFTLHTPSGAVASGPEGDHGLSTMARHSRPIDTAVTLPDGRRLFVADCAGECRLWDVLSGRELHRYPGYGPGEDRHPRGGNWCFTAVAPDGRFILSSKPDNTLVQRDMETGGEIRTLLPACKYHITSVAISPDSRYALCGDQNGAMYYWDLLNGGLVFSQPVGPKTGAVDCVVFSADGKQALTGGHELINRLWDLNTHKQIREYAGATLVVKGIGLGNGGGLIFSVGGDQALRIWDAQTARELNASVQFPRYSYALAVVPSGLSTPKAGSHHDEAVRGSAQGGTVGSAMHVGNAQSKPDEAVLVSSGSLVTLWAASRSLRYLEFSPRLEAARLALRANPDDGIAMKTLGEWYAFRGVNDWAVQLLEKARTNGCSVSSLVLARCYWQLGQMPDAAREFRNARVRREAPDRYIELCLNAVTVASPAAQSATAAATQKAERTSTE